MLIADLFVLILMAIFAAIATFFGRLLSSNGRVSRFDLVAAALLMLAIHLLITVIPTLHL